MKASSDVEGHTLRAADGPPGTCHCPAYLSALRDQDWVHVDELRFEAEDAAQVFGPGGLLEVTLGMHLREVGQGGQRGRAHLLRAYQTLRPERAENLFAPLDFDTWHACGFSERLDFVLRVVPQAHPVFQSVARLSSL